MVREVVHDVLFLGQKSEPATQADKQVAIDLLDTLKAHEEGCVGMAANMIGVKKRIIAVNMGFMNVAMFNPRIVKKSGSYQTEEGCLSLIGVRPCTRYQEIELEYQDMNWKKQRQKYTGWIAQIIQHEVDHCNGIIIYVYFEIFLQRMLMCKRAAEILGLKFKMKANGNKIC